MAFIRAELRAFPRFATSVPVRLMLDGLEEDGQLIDMSRSGCKLLPLRLRPLVEAGVPAGTSLLLAIADAHLEAKVMWATPNLSALGCTFTKPLSDFDLRMLMVPRA